MKTLAEQISAVIDRDEALTGLRVFFATETDAESIEEAKVLSDKDLIASAMEEAKRNYDPETRVFTGTSVISTLPEHLRSTVSFSDSLKRAELRAQLISERQFKALAEYPNLRCDIDSVAQDGISNWWAGDRVMDESSPELMGHQFMRDQSFSDEDGDSMVLTRIMQEEPEPTDEVKPRLDEKGWRMERLKHYASKRVKWFDKLMHQAQQALLIRDGKELHRLNGKLFELRDSSFESRLLLSMTPKLRNADARTRRQAWLASDRTKKVFEESRCLTAEQLKQGMDWFKLAWEAWKAGKNEVIEQPTKVEEAKKLTINVNELFKLWNESKLEELREYWRLANTLSQLENPPRGALLLKSLTEEQGVRLKTSSLGY